MAKQGVIRIRENDFSEPIRPTYHNKKAQVMIKEIEDLVNHFQFSFPDEKNRRVICNIISSYLEVEIVDRTTNEMMDNNGEHNFLVKVDGQEFPLVKYIYNLEMIERKNKLLKIKRTIWQKVRDYR